MTVNFAKLPELLTQWKAAQIGNTKKSLGAFWIL